MNFCGSCRSHNNELLFPQTTLSGWFLQSTECVSLSRRNGIFKHNSG